MLVGAHNRSVKPSIHKHANARARLYPHTQETAHLANIQQMHAKFAWINDEKEKRLETEEKEYKRDKGKATASAPFSSKKEEDAFVTAITSTEAGDDDKLLILLSKYTKKHGRI